MSRRRVVKKIFPAAPPEGKQECDLFRSPPPWKTSEVANAVLRHEGDFLLLLSDQSGQVIRGQILVKLVKSSASDMMCIRRKQNNHFYDRTCAEWGEPSSHWLLGVYKYIASSVHVWHIKMMKNTTHRHAERKLVCVMCVISSNKASCETRFYSYLTWHTFQRLQLSVQKPWLDHQHRRILGEPTKSSISGSPLKDLTQKSPLSFLHWNLANKNDLP